MSLITRECDLLVLETLNVWKLNAVIFFTALSCHCCTRAFSSCVGAALVAAHTLLIAVASLVAEEGL